MAGKENPRGGRLSKKTKGGELLPTNLAGKPRKKHAVEKKGPKAEDVNNEEKGKKHHGRGGRGFRLRRAEKKQTTRNSGCKVHPLFVDSMGGGGGHAKVPVVRKQSEMCGET